MLDMFIIAFYAIMCQVVGIEVIRATVCLSEQPHKGIIALAIVRIALCGKCNLFDVR